MDRTGDSGDGRHILLANLLASGSWRRASEISLELLDIAPGDPVAHRAAGQAALHLDRPGDAAGHLGRAIELDPGDGLAHYFAGHAARLLGDAAGAERSVRRAVELDPAQADYWTELGWLAFERRDYGSARRCASRAEGLAPTCPRAATLAAAAGSELPDGTCGDPHAQLRALGRALELDPDNDAALHNMGVVHFNETGDLRAAERCFRGALAIAPCVPLYQRNLARTLRHRKLLPVLRFALPPAACLLAAGALYTAVSRTPGGSHHLTAVAAGICIGLCLCAITLWGRTRPQAT